MPNNSLIAQVLNGASVERRPVWLMRQAGRYLAEYREMKEKHSFLEMCSSPELALEVTMQPMRAFDLDAAIVFSDILFPLRGMGVKIAFNPGPQIFNPIRDVRDVRELVVSAGDAGNTISRIVRGVRSALDVEFPGSQPKAVLGFAGAPWTLACYLIAQGPFKHFEKTPIFAKEQPQAFAELIDKLTQVVEEFLLQQFEAGADAVQLFDSWGGILCAEDHARFSLPSIQRIASTLERAGCPLILYTGSSSHLLSNLAQSGARCLSLDWRVRLSEAIGNLDSRFVVQGNLDPTDLFLPEEEIKSKVLAMIAQVPRKSHYIVNLGHGVLQGTPRSSVRAFVNAVTRTENNKTKVES